MVTNRSAESAQSPRPGRPRIRFSKTSRTEKPFRPGGGVASAVGVSIDAGVGELLEESSTNTVLLERGVVRFEERSPLGFCALVLEELGAVRNACRHEPGRQEIPLPVSRSAALWEVLGNRTDRAALVVAPDPGVDVGDADLVVVPDRFKDSTFEYQ